MTNQAKVIIGGLVVAVIALAVALGVALATDDDDGGPHMGPATNSYMGMMQAFGSMDSDQMLARMREILGAEGYQRMLDHIAEHRRGGQIPAESMIDGMMHEMMDGMMQQMPADADDIMPMGPH